MKQSTIDYYNQMRKERALKNKDYLSLKEGEGTWYGFWHEKNGKLVFKGSNKSNEFGALIGQYERAMAKEFGLVVGGRRK